MTKPGVRIVHVLSTNNRDYLSLLPATTTLTRTTIPTSPIACIVDRQTRDFASSIGFRFQDWVDEIVIAEAPHASPVMNSRHLKTSMRSLVSGDFLYLDIDAVVVDSRLLAQLDASCIAASQNVDSPDFSARFPGDIARSIYSPLGWDWPFLPYVNGGVLFCRDNDECHTLFRRWHELWNEQWMRLGICLDQPSLNRAIWEMPGCLKLLPPSCNSSVAVVPESDADACVYHYWISLVTGKPCPESLLGLLSEHIRRSKAIDTSLVRRALIQKRAFFPGAATLEDTGTQPGQPRVRVDVTVILVAHAEGRLVHATARSALRALSHLRESGHTGELLAVLDRPSDETEAYFDHYRDCFDRVLRSDFGDPGLARNLGVRHSLGDFVAILDGDDLFCDDWLTKSFEFCGRQSEEEIVAHSEYWLFFDAENRVFVHEEGTDESELALIEYNRWTALCFAPRVLIEQVPYRPTNRREGSGYEDWLLNCDLSARGAVHRVVPGTVHFRRSKLQGSRLKDDHAARVTTLASDFFELPMWKASQGEIDAFEKDLNKPKLSFPSLRRLAGHALAASLRWVAKPIAKRLLEGNPHSYERARLIARAWRTVAKRLLDENVNERPTRQIFDRLPQWLLRDLAAIHEIEPALFPTLPLRGRVIQERVSRSRIAVPYRMINALYPPRTSHVLLVPWLKRGGADLVVIQYARALLETGARVTCITTEKYDSPWSCRLPGEVDLIEEGRLASRLSMNERCKLLQRLLLQKKPQVIHIINSTLGYEVVARYGQSLKTRSSIFASVFCSEFTLEGQRVGYPTRELVTAYDHLTGIITDNSSFVDYLVGTFAFERKLFHSLRQPIVQAVPPVERSADAETVGVLWAGRLVRQKRPDILIRVAEAAKSLPVHFHVYGEPQRESREYVRKLTGLKNVSYHGVFEGFDSLPVRTFDIFLYTAQWDGTPNVVLEAMGSGMACIAPRIGGIPESIDESNGCLVSEPGAISEYIHFLSDLCSDRRMLRAKGFAAAKKMSRDNSWTGFVEALTSIPDYGLRSSEAAPRRDPEEVA